MSELKATPGPWALREVSDLDIAYSVDAGRSPVADVYNHPAEWQANANLIAAAPEMFAALEMQRNWLKGYISNGGLSGLEELIAIEAALKRTRGQS